MCLFSLFMLNIYAESVPLGLLSLLLSYLSWRGVKVRLSVMSHPIPSSPLDVVTVAMVMPQHHRDIERPPVNASVRWCTGVSFAGRLRTLNSHVIGLPPSHI